MSIYQGKVVLVVNVASRWLVFFLVSSTNFGDFFFYYSSLLCVKQRFHRIQLYPPHRTLPEIQGPRSWFIYNLGVLFNAIASPSSPFVDFYPFHALPFSGFEILAFPCNQFLYQEPGTSQEAHEFACTRYKAEYPVFQKVGMDQHASWP